MSTSPARAMGRLFEPFHTVTYYPSEAQRYSSLGYRGWWHAYFGYRAAPMGTVNAAVITATFYNFAPRMVAMAVPDVWEVRSPAATIDLRSGLVAEALNRIFSGTALDGALRGGAEVARRAIEGCEAGARPLYAGYAALHWPDEPAMALWHACTLLREHRGDSHNLALAAAGVDGVESHVLMAARGYGNRPTILAIRGWTGDEWDAAVERLVSRGLVAPDGSFTAAGRRKRSAIERHTDALAGEPVRRLGDEGVEAFVRHLTPLVHHLLAEGEVAGRWPPRHLEREA